MELNYLHDGIIYEINSLKVKYNITYKDGTVKTAYTETKYKIENGFFILKDNIGEIMIPVNAIREIQETDLTEFKKAEFKKDVDRWDAEHGLRKK